MALYSLDPKEQAELETIDALLEAGLICVFPNAEGVEVRGYANKISVSGRGYMHMPLDRGLAVRMVARVVAEQRHKIREREDRELTERLVAEKAVESVHE